MDEAVVIKLDPDEVRAFKDMLVELKSAVRSTYYENLARKLFRKNMVVSDGRIIAVTTLPSGMSTRIEFYMIDNRLMVWVGGVLGQLYEIRTIDGKVLLVDMSMPNEVSDEVARLIREALMVRY